MDSQDSINNLRVASFSSYLYSTEENFVLKLTGGIQDPLNEIVSPEETPRPGRPKTKEGEIGVFGADKYFNMGRDYETDNGRMKKEDRVQLHGMKPKLRNGTATVSSEASWNSQTALLPSFLRNPSPIKQKKGNGKSFFAGFGCNGSCLDKKSVDIRQGVEHGMVQRKEVRKESFQFPNPVTFDGTKESQPGLRGCENFTFPILKSGVENLTVKKQLEEEKVEEKPRYSIEVFGSDTMKKDDIGMNLERKLSMLTWDAIPKSQNLPSTLGSIGGPFDDIQSDASSDLFELETLSCTGNPLYTEKTSCYMTPTTQYEPSEASIEWSVVTASAVDFSVVSDYDEKSVIAGEMTSTNKTSKMAKTKNVVPKEGQKSRPGSLLGCKSHKAVSVAETAYRTSDHKAKSMSGENSQVGKVGGKNLNSHRCNILLPPGKSPASTVQGFHVSVQATGQVQ